MVRACQFKIDDTLQPEEIPFCGEATANKIKDIARTGTTSVLEAHTCCLFVVTTALH
jgi:DNA polymerase/3'-5' exonuclease PolX